MSGEEGGFDRRCLRLTSRRTVAAPLLSIALGLPLLACGKEDSPPSATPPGAAKKADTKALEKGAELLQDLSAVRGLDHYLNGFHVMRDEPTLHMEAHHFCKGINEELTQCVIFDGNTKDANIIGIEYIVSAELFEQLEEEEKRSWHPHNYEILSGQLVLPAVPSPVEKAALAKKLNSYGKTWHVWDTGHVGHPAAQRLPVGSPKLAWSYNRDGEMPAEMVRARDERMGVDTSQRRQSRAELSSRAQPQRGVDLLKDRLPGSSTPHGVVAK